MLTFFRQIRKSLLSAGAARKYLLYAIGEIALVVIGILIALQINNWNEQRKERKLGSKNIHSIYRNLKRDSTVIQEYIRIFQDQYESVESAMMVFEEKDIKGIDSLSFINNVYTAPSIIVVDRPKSVWDDLLSTGKTHILGDEHLVEQLQDYYLKYDNRIRNYNSFPAEFRNDIRKILNENSDLQQIRKGEFADNHSFYRELNKEQFEMIIGNDQIPRKLTGIMRSAKWHVISFQKQLSQIHSIINYVRMHHSIPES